MKVDYPVTPVIYVLPKIHKDLTNPPGRPIISGIGSLTEKISTFVDFFLKPVVFTLPSFVKDSIDMIKIKKTIDLPDEILFVTFDVESLYTNIPHEGGIEAMEFFLRDPHQNKNPSANCIKTLAKLVLTKKKFRYEDDFFLQIKGTAMGSTMAPNYANLYRILFSMVYKMSFSQTLYFGEGILMISLCYGQVLKINCYTFTVSLTLVMNTYVSQLIMMIHVLVFGHSHY